MSGPGAQRAVSEGPITSGDEINQVDDFTVAVVLRIVLAYPHWEHSDQMLSALSTTTSTKNTRKIAKKMSTVVTWRGSMKYDHYDAQGADLPPKSVFPVYGSTSKARLVSTRIWVPAARWRITRHLGSAPWAVPSPGQSTAQGYSAPQPRPPLPRRRTRYRQPHKHSCTSLQRMRCKRGCSGGTARSGLGMTRSSGGHGTAQPHRLRAAASCTPVVSNEQGNRRLKSTTQRPPPQSVIAPHPGQLGLSTLLRSPRARDHRRHRRGQAE
ncbi:hypothetical protein DFH06DRAFT_1147776 [Mycena polygramma]|nr:hypothetical protein DFH06DRAFT_1147776 [Mycena polygramma]